MLEEDEKTLHFRCGVSTIKAIDAIAIAKHGGNRSKAIRHLIDLGLATIYAQYITAASDIPDDDSAT